MRRTSGRRRATSLDASRTLDDVSATTTATELTDCSVGLTYASFGGHSNAVDGSGSGGSFTGTATRGDGATCTIPDSVEAPTVSRGWE